MRVEFNGLTAQDVTDQILAFADLLRPKTEAPAGLVATGPSVVTDNGLEITPVVIPPAQQVQPVVETPKRSHHKKKPEPAKPVYDPSQDEVKPAVTLELVQDLGRKAAQDGKIEGVKALMADYMISKFSSLDPKDYADFAAKLQAL